MSRRIRVIHSRTLARQIGGLFVLSFALLSGDVFGQSSLPTSQPAAQLGGQRDLSQIPIEDLMNIQVTSVSKTEQKLSQAAAAIFVITQEDIRRSGAMNIPDLLRMVPGMDVSQISANDWAVSARGFNQQFSNKLLVLIDGRAVYTPLLGGVNWDTQDVPLEDIDRIEVIRGPGATLWGANAVNGVINVVTKRAGDTQGALVTAGGGTQNQAFGTAQFGGTIRGNTSYRAFMKYLNQGSLPEMDGKPGEDAWHLLHGGFRADTNISTKDSLTLQGDIFTGVEGGSIIHLFSIDPPVIENIDVLNRLSGGNVLGRWDHTFSSRSDTTFQFYFDNYKRTGPESRETRNTIDFDFNHHFVWGSRQDVVWGTGYRRTWDQDLGTIDQAFDPPDTNLRLFTFFVQDTIALQHDRLFLTAGTKVEDSYFTGFGVEPSVRLAWTPSKRMTLWSAVSRAERTPNQRDTGLNASLAAFPDPLGSSTPVEVILFGNPEFQSEHVLAYEAGFRAQPNGRISVDVSTFFNRYDHLVSLEPGAESFPANPCSRPLCHSHHVCEPDVWHNRRRRDLREFETHGSLDVEPELRIPGNASAHQTFESGRLVRGGVRGFEPPASGAVAVSRGPVARPVVGCQRVLRQRLTDSGRRFLHAHRYTIKMEICGTRGFQRGRAESASGPSPRIAWMH